MLEIKNLHLKTENKEILKGINLKLEKGKLYVLMGPNGSGKTSLVNAIMNNPKYKISGKILFNKKDITKLKPHQKAKLGIFISFQHPIEIPGLNLSEFLRTSYNSLKRKNISQHDFENMLKEKLKLVNLKEEILDRDLKGLSGGESKKLEILQMLVLDPKLAILDEPDSGLDIDSLKIISKALKSFLKKDKTILLITHQKNILKYLRPPKVFIMLNGKIILEGSENIIKKIEKQGYNLNP
jgi:Fe-S cluster assembly ATP-binding protein